MEGTFFLITFLVRETILCTSSSETVTPQEMPLEVHSSELRITVWNLQYGGKVPGKIASMHANMKGKTRLGIMGIEVCSFLPCLEYIGKLV